MLEYARTWLALRFDKRGVTALEYGIIAALMGAALVVSVGFLTSGLHDAFTAIQNTLKGTS
jgi:pilus assembly protein Flp/PilA